MLDLVDIIKMYYAKKDGTFDKKAFLRDMLAIRKSDKGLSSRRVPKMPVGGRKNV